MYCEKCGTKIEEGAEFCQNCGKSTSSAGISDTVSQTTPEVSIKCGNCDYIGAPEKARNIASMILAWLCIFFAPLITLIYFAVTHKYRCPKCKSTFLGVRNNSGAYTAPTKRSPLMVLVWVIVGIAVIGIISSVILASLNSAREKAKSAESSYNLNN